MIIDEDHPLAPYTVLLKGGRPVACVKRANLVSRHMVRVDPEEEVRRLMDPTAPSPVEIPDEFDEVWVREDMPEHLRSLVPPHIKFVSRDVLYRIIR